MRRRSSAVLAAGLWLAGCAPHRVKVTPPYAAPAQYHDTWAAQETLPQVFTVYVRRPQGQGEAQRALCTHSYVCTLEDAGRIIIITRTRK